jgi:hypothetical protein
MRPTRLVPEIASLTPTSYDAFTRCPRTYLLAHLLSVPASDDAASADRGLLVHEMLRLVHERGTCHDEGHVVEVLAAHGADDDLTLEMLRRHARRCPADWEREAHEVDLARFHRAPPPMYMATARIDAVWVHDGLLDARDYKTGARHHDRVVDDPRARVQAYVLAPRARGRGLRLRLRYEHLTPEVDDDPEPFEPDEDDLAVIEEELRAAVEAMWGDDPWRGVGEAEVCGRCRYRSICPDSAAPAEAGWPVLSLAAEDGS